MDNVVKLAEKLGERHKKALEQQQKSKSGPQVMTSAQIMKFSRENNWVSYHDIITADGFIPKVRRFAMNQELRKNYGRLPDVLKSMGLLKKKTDYEVLYHSEIQLFEVYECKSEKSVILIKSSECAQVWDW